MKTNTARNHILERPVANAVAPGAMGDSQRRAIWAKRNNPSAIGTPPRTMTQTTPTPFPHQLITVAPTPFPGQLASKPAPASSLRILVGADGSKQLVQPVTPPASQPPATTPPAQARKWGETRPGEMYAQVEGPGNPSWEKRHPELAPTPGHPNPDNPHQTPPIIPTKPIGAPSDNKPAQPSTPAQTRKWGESRPGEMYVQVEGPGNPSWEKRHPELAPAGGTVAPPQHHVLDTPPTKTLRASTGISYGNDARTVAPTDPNQAIRAKIDSIRQTLPAASPAPASAPVPSPAAAPQPRAVTPGMKLLPQAVALAKSKHVPTPGHPNPDNPYQTPPIIAPQYPSPVPIPKQPPFQVPAGVRRSKPQAKKSYVKNWYRGATTQ